MKNNILVTIILAVVVGVGGFFGGMKYQQSKQPSRPNFQTRMGMRQGDGNVLGNQRPAGSEIVRGEIIDQGEASITVKLPDESSKIILISENTTISKASEGVVDDLKMEEQVMIFGQTNSDGSVSATQIQLNSGFRFDRMPQRE